MTLSSCWSTTDLVYISRSYDSELEELGEGRGGRGGRGEGRGGREEGKEKGKEGRSGCSNTVLLLFCKSLIVSCILVVH